MIAETYLAYDILSGTSINELKAAVRLAGRSGWKPQGGVSVVRLGTGSILYTQTGSIFYTQAVVKEIKYRMDIDSLNAS